MKRIILLTAAIAVMMACTKEEQPGLNLGSDETTEVRLLAYAPGTNGNTKSILADNGTSVLWEDGDKIKISFPPKGSTSNSDPKTAATFTLETTLSESSAEAYFLGNISDLTKYVDGYALYPTSAEHKSIRNGYSVTNSFSYDLANIQSEGFGAYNLSTSYVNRSNLTNHTAKAYFLNACGLIRIVLPQSEDDIISISVKSQNGKALTGNADLTLSPIKGIGIDIDANGSINNNDYSYRLISPTFTDGGNDEVTLTNGGNAFQPGIEYNIVVWPGTHSGLTFTFVNSEGKECTKVLSQQVVLEASKFDKFNFKSEFIFTDKPVLEVSKTNLTPAATGETLSFNVNANFNWTIKENVDWITVSPASGAAGNTTVNVTFAENISLSNRTATITVAHLGGLERTISVSQNFVTFKISGEKLTYASELTDGLYVIESKYYDNTFWKESNGKLVVTNSEPVTFYNYHVFEYKSNSSKINKSIDNYYSWSAGSWKSLSTGKYLDENFNLTADESNALYLIYANNWGGTGGNELDGYDVYHSKTTSSSKYTLWYNGSNFVFDDMNEYYEGGSGVNKRKYYVYRVEKQ